MTNADLPEMDEAMAAAYRANPYASHAELGLMRGDPVPAGRRVDVTNALMTPPFNRWAYQNMRQIFPSAAIPNPPVPTPVEIVADGRIDDLRVARPDGTMTGFDDWLRETYTDALVVVRDGRIVGERYLNGMRAQAAHQMFSVTKSFAGLFALMAVAEGRLDEDRRVGELIPELAPAGGFAEATVGQVMDMTNSMAFSEEYDNPESDIGQYARVLGWAESSGAARPVQSLFDYLAGLGIDPARAHGAVFSYQTPKADVVNWLTNRAIGKTFVPTMYDALWSPLGTDGEAYVLLDRCASPIAGGGLNAAPHDLARFAMMLLAGGCFAGRQIVAPGVIDTIARGGSVDAFLAGPEGEGFMGDRSWSYRAQWWVRHQPGREAFTAIGVHGQWIYIDRDRGVGIIKQSSLPESDNEDMTRYNLNGFDAIIDRLAS